MTMRFRLACAFAPALIVLTMVLALGRWPSAAAVADGPSYLFCFWNVENLFDDKLDGWKNDADREFDSWFSRDERARKQKLENLSNVLVRLNDGRGPDILALAEVESERAAELLAEYLNARLKKPALHYKHVVFKDTHGGRAIATAVITRLPVIGGKARLLGQRQRILEVHLQQDGHDLTVLATHWSSRVADERGEARARYADQIYNEFKRQHRANPQVKMLICGDFNDNPDDPSVTRHLHAVADPARVKASSDEPLLFNLFGRRWEEIEKLGKREGGTHYFRGRPNIFDQIVVAPGLLERSGWFCDVGSAEVAMRGDKLVDRRKVPLRFGSERERFALEDRGCSDHLPVTVRLTVLPAK